jgi:superfamily II RNA helicase
VADDLRNVKTVIFDEFHYMNDKERGIVWEESIMHSPEHIQLVPLSATIPNAIELANWFKRINPTKNVQIIRANPNDRHVPLRYFTYDKNFIPLMDEYINPDKLLQQLMEERMGEKKEKTLSRLGEIYYGIQDPYKGIEILTDYVNGDEIKKQSLYYNLIYDKKLSEDEAAAISESLVENDSRTINPSIQSLQANYTNEDSLPTIELIRTLSKQDMLPAIFFIFSKKSCDKQVERYIEYTKKSGCKSLLTEKEQKQVKKIIKEYNDKGIFLGANFDPKGLLLGVAAHHAGMLPGYRDLVEQLFQKKLIKVVFATETLSAGINMPTRTTDITSLMKPDNSDLTKKQNNNQQNSDKSALRCLTSTELKQMTGRAGRRGIDTIGNVIILNSSNNALDQAVNLIKSDPDPIKSNFKPSYSFLSFFLNHNENMQDITQIVEKSFLLDSVKSNNILNAKNSVIYDFDRIKNIFKKRGFIELKPGTTNSWNVTPLGQLASKARGINEVLLSELVYNAKLNGLSPEGFAAVIATMKQDRVPNLQENIDFSDFYKIFKKQGFADQFEEIKNDINYIKNLSSEIDIAQIKEGLNEPKTQIDVAIVPYIFMWANACKRTNDQDKEKCYQAWENVVTALQKDRIITYEGQFAKNINSTIDILNQIQSLSNNMKSRFKPDTDEFKLYKKQEYLAKEAVKSLKKPPIGEVIWDYDSEPGVVV